MNKIETDKKLKQLSKALEIKKEDREKEQIEQIKIKAYWEGYIQKQNEAVEICKI